MDPLASAGLTAFILILTGFLLWWFLVKPKSGDKCYPKDDDRVDGTTVYTLKGKKCTPNACATGFTFDATSNTCTKNIEPDPIIPGTSCSTYVGTKPSTNALTFKYGQSQVCDQIASCNATAGYMLINGSCVKDKESCTPYEWQGAAAGTALIVGDTTGICIPTAPTSGDFSSVSWSGVIVEDGIVKRKYTVPSAKTGDNMVFDVEVDDDDFEIYANTKCKLGDYVTKGAYVVDEDDDDEAAEKCATTYCSDNSCKGIVYSSNAGSKKANCFILDNTSASSTDGGEPHNGSVCIKKKVTSS